MVFPLVLSRMKQPNNFLCLRIYSSNVRPFVVITGKTRQREVTKFVCSVMFAGNDVINLKSEEVILLRHPTVLAD
jgi:hypothetical protein